MPTLRNAVDMDHISRVLRKVVSQHGQLDTSKDTNNSERSLRVSAPRRTQASISAKLIQGVRKDARHLFSASMISDPAFDILLELFVSSEEGRRLSVTEVLRRNDVPVTTGLRWLTKLEAEKLIAREQDQFDARRSFIKLTESGRAQMSGLIARSKIGPST